MFLYVAIQPLYIYDIFRSYAIFVILCIQNRSAYGFYECYKMLRTRVFYEKKDGRIAHPEGRKKQGLYKTKFT